ncbi:hypothetical protein [Thermosulfurimonas sp. F29]|uniref:hypothetical protein n=1 Tax=Thermosulfurimonas sp. F29 TaxID=2867247 RepID=UPI001C82D46C|nr:hypothetical protein [Thermosulfurimonas sp. F29]MBX6423387.1 hypothetical protein [Thermosulfurimonas sp. F29]
MTERTRNRSESNEEPELNEDRWCRLVNAPSVFPIPIVPLIWSVKTPAEDLLVLAAGGVFFCPIALVVEIFKGFSGALVVLGGYLLVFLVAAWLLAAEFARFPRRRVAWELLRDLLYGEKFLSGGERKPITDPSERFPWLAKTAETVPSETEPA